MTVHLRFKGWRTDGTLDVTDDAIDAMADLAEDVRDLSAENASLTRHSEALLALLEAIKRHGTDCDEFQDACLDALRAMAG